VSGATTSDPYIERIAAAIEGACERILTEHTRPERRWLTVKEAAAEIRYSPSRVADLLAKWALPVSQGGFGLLVRRQPGTKRGRWLICRHSLDRMVERHWR